MKPPRRLFRDRRRRPVLYVGAAAAPYLPELARLGATLGPGAVRVAEVRHDDGCPIFVGGACNCDCVVSLVPTPEEN